MNNFHEKALCKTENNSSACPSRSQKIATPRPTTRSQLGCRTCTPRQESGQLLLRLRCSCLCVCASAELAALTTAPNVSPTSGRPCSALGLQACPATPKPRPGAAHYRPEVGIARPPRPITIRARQLGLRFVRGCHEGCSRLQSQELLSIVPPRCRIPLAREPLGTRVPAASSQACLPPAQPRQAFGGPVH